VTPSSEFNWSQRLRRNDDSNAGGGTTTGANGASWPGITGIASRYRPRNPEDSEASGHRSNHGHLVRTFDRSVAIQQAPLWPARPQAVATPISRTDTASAESTVYAVRYHPVSESTPPIAENSLSGRSVSRSSSHIPDQQNIGGIESDESDKPVVIEDSSNAVDIPQRRNPWGPVARLNPFRKHTQDPPAEVSAHSVTANNTTNDSTECEKWDVRSRLENFAAAQASRLRDRARPAPNVASLPVTVIPAPSRSRPLAGLIEETEPDPASESSRISAQPRNYGARSNSNNNGAMPMSLPRDPYTPVGFDSEAVTQRGSLSFANTIQHDWDRQQHELAEMAIRHESQQPGNVRESLNHSALSNRSSISVRPDGVQVVSVKAPPRRTRTNE